MNVETTLEQFIQYIPTCHQDSQIESWRSAIVDHSQDMVAIVDGENKPLGVVYCHSLLWLEQQKLSQEQEFSDYAQVSLAEVMTETICLPSQMKIKDFLTCFAVTSQNQKQDYFVVDPVGKLLGILNIKQLSQALWSKSNKETDFIQDFQKINPHFAFFLTQLSLPLQLKNSQGEVCYQNHYWQKQINQDLTQSPPRNQIELKPYFTSLTEKYRQKQQISKFKIGEAIEQSCSQSTKTIDYDFQHYHCHTVNNLLVKSCLTQDLQQQVNQLSFSLETANREENLTRSTASVDNTNSDCGNYYQLPLNIKYDSINISDSPNYLLILATQFFHQKKLDQEQKNHGKEIQVKLKRLQDELTINLSHDVKSPLTAIIGLASLLKEEKIGNLNKNQIRYSEMIYYSGKKLINLINEFLDLTRLTTRKLQLNWESINIDNSCEQIYQQIIQKFKATASLKNQAIRSYPKIQLQIDPFARTAMADSAYFNQILTCFLEIALELTNSEELLGVTTEYWSNWLAITVWNRGSGLTEAQQSFVTEELSQYINLLTSQEKNQGLGLILAQQLAQVHGGDISFVSHNNYGSEFTVLLPIQPQHREQLETDYGANQTYAYHQNNLVLIVETASQKIVDLHKKFKNLGYHCAIARSQKEAISKARNLKPFKILVNSSVIESQECHLLELLQSDPLTCNIPIILLEDRFAGKRFPNYDVNGVIKFPIKKANLIPFFTPIKSQESNFDSNLTVLRLSLKEKINQATENLALDFVFENPSFSFCYHIIEADSLEQAELLAKIWNIDAIIWDGATLESPNVYLESFAQLNVLAHIPIITLDTKTTAAANKITNLSVFPCLLPANERSIEQLTQVINIATGCE